jgi:hypothetical protein
MHARRAIGLCALVTVILLLPRVPSAQDTATDKPLLEEAQAGSILVNFGPGPRFLEEASDALAARYGKILLRCRVIEQVKEREAKSLWDHALRLPDNLDSVRAVAALSNAEVVELSPLVVLMQWKGDDCADLPVVLTAQQIPFLGLPIDASLDSQQLEVRLFQDGGPRRIGQNALAGPDWNAVYYWASREGHGREIYVQTQSSAALSAQAPARRGIEKVAVETSDGHFAIRHLWGAGCDGPVAAIEHDFDGDGIVDIVCSSGGKGMADALAPLVIHSGANGAVLGTLDGFEFLLTATAGGGIRTETLGADGYRTYETKGGRVVLTAFEKRAGKALEAIDRPMGPRTGSQVNPPALAAGERVLDHFRMRYQPSALTRYPREAVPELRFVGGALTLSATEKSVLATADVLLDYVPDRIQSR